MITMIIWILLVSLFDRSTQDGNGKEHAVLPCGPQNMTLTTPDEKLLLTWEDDPACLAVDDVLMYELVVLVANKQVHHDEITVTSEQLGSTHSWNWTPHLPLECVSYLVRLSSRYKNHTSPWKQEQTPDPDIDGDEVKVFPRDRLFRVGSRATFCCVLPVGEIFDKMFIRNYPGDKGNTTRISNQTYTWTIDLNQASKPADTDIQCKGQNKDGGASNVIGYPPGDKDLRCETRDLQSVECLWTEENNMFLYPTEYQLLGSPCVGRSKMRCTQKVHVGVGEQNWTLTARNKLGTVELTDRADLTKRVHMFAPKVSVSAVNARNVSLELAWNVQQYDNLNITCQVRASHGETHTTHDNFGVGLKTTVLENLIPNWTYTVMVRCGTTQDFWKWSEWSSTIKFLTKSDVPDALDVWMKTTNNQIIISWKTLLANQSHGDIIDYEVTWAPTKAPERINRTKVAHPKDSLALSLDTTEEYVISVTSGNINGSSSPSTITIPNFDPDSMKASRILGSDGGFNLSWSANPTASCGYIVDWYPIVGESRVDWLKVPPSETNTNIFSKKLKDGLRYLLSIYACTQGAPLLLGRREGYIREKRIKDGLFENLKWKQRDTDAEVSWDPISLRAQTAFIRGYVLHCLDTNNNILLNVSTDDPEATSLTARNLNISSYKFTVKAQTAVGECGDSSITATLNSQTDELIKAIIISLVTVFGLLSLTTILCCRHWKCIKRKIYPPIPKPVLSEFWLTSPGERRRPQCMDTRHHSEAHIVDVAEVLYKSGTHVNGYITVEKPLHTFTQTPKGYYNNPLKKNIPRPLILHPTVPSGSPSSVTCAFPNRSYDLMMQTEDQQFNSRPDFLEGTRLARCFSGYQSQSSINSPEDSVTPLYCSSTYTLLPNSHSH